MINGFLCVRETESTSEREIEIFSLLLCVSKPLFRPQGSSQPESFINDEWPSLCIIMWVCLYLWIFKWTYMQNCAEKYGNAVLECFSQFQLFGGWYSLFLPFISFSPFLSVRCYEKWIEIDANNVSHVSSSAAATVAVSAVQSRSHIMS